MKISGIYQITCIPTGDTYVGSSTNIHKRWIAHRNTMLNGLSTFGLQRLHDAYGIDSFEFGILERCLTGELMRMEQAYIDALNPTLNVSQKAYNAFCARQNDENYIPEMSVIATSPDGETSLFRSLESCASVAKCTVGNVFRVCVGDSLSYNGWQFTFYHLKELMP